MPVAMMSTKGQVVIPAEVRRAAGLAAGDAVVIQFDEAAQEIRLRKAASIADEIDRGSSRFARLVGPGVTPLEDAGAFFETREPRL